jgi:hypothetical protein
LQPASHKPRDSWGTDRPIRIGVRFCAHSATSAPFSTATMTNTVFCCHSSKTASTAVETASVESNMEMEDTTQEISRLRYYINDLVSILTLPSIWTGRDFSRVPTTLLDVLVRMLDQTSILAMYASAMSATDRQTHGFDRPSAAKTLR